MGILSWVLLGLVAGIIAKFLHPGPDPGGWIITILLGIGGAMLGGFIASTFGLGSVDGFDLWSIIIATGGAFLILWIYSFLRRKK